MVNFPIEHSFTSADGIKLVWQEMGGGRPLLLVHGFFSDAETNWIKYGHAEKLADAGFRVIMPDLRAHGLSDKPHNLRHYSKDILADDQFDLIEHLGLTDFDLGGYSLGARTVARMLVRGCKPRRAIISGMGLSGLIATEKRAEFFKHILDNLGNHERGSPEWMAEAFLKTTGGDALALRNILDTFVNTTEAELVRLQSPITIICGEDDQNNGYASELVNLLQYGDLITVPGNHMSAVVQPELGIAFVDALKL